VSFTNNYKMDPQPMEFSTEEASAKRTVVSDSLPKATKQRLNLDLAPAAYDLLKQLSEDTGKTMAEVLRTGLALYGIAQDARKQKQGLGIVEDNKIVKEIIIP
jgi:hypothetical protein